MEKEDFDTMKSELETLQQALYAAGAAVYQQATGAGGAPGADGAGAAGSSPAGDDVIDAEFTESK
jgi:molecular chaperone DnaK